MSKITLPPRKETEVKEPEAKAVEAVSSSRTAKVVKVVAGLYPMATPGGHFIPTDSAVEVPWSSWIQSQITEGLLKEV